MHLKSLSVDISIVLFCVTAVFSSTPSTLPSVCNSACDGPLKNTSVVVQRCKDGTVLHRCCLNTSSISPTQGQVLGIDLGGCNIYQINDSLLPLDSLVTVVLDRNPLKGDLESQFSGLTRIEYLSLPSDVNCPGRNGSWDNITTSSTETICEGQINQCTANNFTCPQNSYCLPNGPGQVLCLCKEGYYGYKCLQSGRFHTEAYAVGLGVVTFVLSLFLWITQRRHAKKRD